MSAGSPVRSPWQFDRLELFDVTAEIQAVALLSRLEGQVVPPLLKLSSRLASV
jgi:hypothetical protein